MRRKIVHLDADSFFASVERALDPSLVGKPIAVGGGNRGIVASASYEARAMGVYTPMPSSQALKICPQLVLISGRHRRYEEFSAEMFAIIRRYTPLVEQCSIDEGYFEFVGRKEPIMELAGRVREEIRQRLRIPVSLGMGTNKLVTQIASKLRKPESFYLVPPGTEGMFMYPLSNRWLPGVGEKTGQALDRLRLYKVYDILQAPEEMLQRVVGSYASDLKQFALGVDERPLCTETAEAKSYGMQETFETDLEDHDRVERFLKRGVDKLAARLRADDRYAKTLSIKIRYVGMSQAQGAESLSEASCLAGDFYPFIRPLLDRIWTVPTKIRMAGVTLSNLYTASEINRPLPFWGNVKGSPEMRKRLADTVDALQRRLGRDSIRPARDLED